jgi:hypothetical protein
MPARGEALYSGFGDRTLEVTLTGRADGSDHPYSDSFIITIAPEPGSNYWVFLVAPMTAFLNDSFSVFSSISNRTSSRMRVQLRPTRQDLTAGSAVEERPGQDLELAPGRSDRIAVINEHPSWSWVDHPTYQARGDQEEHRIRYALTAIWTDEFNNDYAPAAALPVVMRVSVPEAKLEAASVAYSLFLATTGFTICGIIGGILGAAASETIVGALIAAGFAAVCAGIAAGTGVGYAHWSQIADDPPSANERYWELVNIDALEPGKAPDQALRNELAMLQALGASDSIAQLVLAGSETYGRLLGAGRAGLRTLEQAHDIQLKRISSLIAANVNVLLGSREAALKEFGTYVSADKLAAAIPGFRGTGISQEQRAGLLKAGFPTQNVETVSNWLKNASADRMQVFADVGFIVKACLDTSVSAALANLSAIETWRSEKAPGRSA